MLAQGIDYWQGSTGLGLQALVCLEGGGEWELEPQPPSRPKNLLEKPFPFPG